MEQSRIFQYDVFLSHRTGDGAAGLRSALEQRGCTVWFDNDTPLADRRLLKNVGGAFGNSRTILAFLSPEHQPSPWTTFEMIEALRSELAPNERLLFFIPEHTNLENLEFPPEISNALKTHHRFSEPSIDALAKTIRERNTITIPNSELGFHAVPPVLFGRMLARLDAALTRYSSLTANKPPPDDQIPGKEIRAFYIDASGDILEQLRTAPEILDIGMQGQTLCHLRSVQESASTSAAAELTELLRGVAAAFVRSRNTFDRANALYLLHHLAKHDRISCRLLRLRLSVERDWGLVRVVAPGRKADAAWWPKRLRGVEAELLEQKKLIDSATAPTDAIPFLAPGIRLALSRTRTPRDFRVDALPPSYRVDISLHWINRLAHELETAHVDTRAKNDSDVRDRLQAIDAQQSYSELQRYLAQLFCESPLDSGVIGAALDRSASATERLITASELFDGIPFSGFVKLFVDHMLHILGLFILILDPDKSALLARRAIAIVAPFVDPREVDAYEAFVADCVQYRQDGHQGLCDGAPLALYGSAGFQNKGAQFKEYWYLRL